MPTPLKAPSPSPRAATGSPSPMLGGASVGGTPDLGCSGIPSLSPLPHNGGGDAAAREERDQRGPPALEDPDPEGPIWRDGAFRRDAWTRATADSPLPDAPLILSKTRWLAERDRLAGRNGPLGLQIEPGEAIEDIGADLPRFVLITLNFPKFSDGRGFSTARLLREKHGFAGELRAVGNVLSDQIPFLRRVGFDSFEVTHAPTRRALSEGRIADVKLYYQPTGLAEPAAGTRPWLRRSAD
jgi:uncharacterized protein (DUF934 family)